MVYPARNNKFEIDIGESPTEKYAAIKDVESYSVSVDGSVEEWNSYDAEGWTRRLMTGKSITISLSGKRNVGDEGNDFVAGKIMAMGEEAEAKIKWTLPSGATLVMPCVINLKNAGAGEANSPEVLEADFMSNGKPAFTPA